MTTWIPDSCTLPTADRPLRSDEFDALFRTDLRGSVRAAPSTLLLSFATRPQLLETLTDLVVHETECCSFFRFEVREDPGSVTLRVAVPSGYVDVLDSLERRADALQASGTQARSGGMTWNR